MWIVDAAGLARRRAIRLGNAGTEQLVEVQRGLTPTDKLISSDRELLVDGDRVSIVGEDANLGRSSQSTLSRETTGHGTG